MFGWAYTSYSIVDYKLKQYFSLTPNQLNQSAVNNPRSFQPKRTGRLVIWFLSLKRDEISLFVGMPIWCLVDDN